MNSADLVRRIQSDLDTIPGYIHSIAAVLSSRSDEPSTTLGRLAAYNYQTCLEVRALSGVEVDFEIDDRHLDQMETALIRYLNDYAPSNEDLRCYVTALSLYLTFIAHRPLHPPGGTGEFRIRRQGEHYYCSGKRRFIRDPGSLCRFCVCRPGLFAGGGISLCESEPRYLHSGEFR